MYMFRKSSDSKIIDLLVTGCVSGRTARTDVSIYIYICWCILNTRIRNWSCDNNSLITYRIRGYGDMRMMEAFLKSLHQKGGY